MALKCTTALQAVKGFSYALLIGLVISPAPAAAFLDGPAGTGKQEKDGEERDSKGENGILKAAAIVLPPVVTYIVVSSYKDRQSKCALDYANLAKKKMQKQMEEALALEKEAKEKGQIELREALGREQRTKEQALIQVREALAREQAAKEREQALLDRENAAMERQAGSPLLTGLKSRRSSSANFPAPALNTIADDAYRKWQIILRSGRPGAPNKDTKQILAPQITDADLLRAIPIQVDLVDYLLVIRTTDSRSFLVDPKTKRAVVGWDRNSKRQLHPAPGRYWTSRPPGAAFFENPGAEREYGQDSKFQAETFRDIAFTDFILYPSSNRNTRSTIAKSTKLSESDIPEFERSAQQISGTPTHPVLRFVDTTDLVSVPSVEGFQKVRLPGNKKLLVSNNSGAIYQAFRDGDTGQESWRPALRVTDTGGIKPWSGEPFSRPTNAIQIRLLDREAQHEQVGGFEYVVRGSELRDFADQPLKPADATPPLPSLLTVSPTGEIDPFYPGYKKFYGKSNDLTRGLKAQGSPVVVTGRVLLPDGTPVKGAEIHLWQTDDNGQYNDKQDPSRGRKPLDPNFGYWGTTKTATAGAYEFRTIRPRWYPVVDGVWERPDHIHLAVYVDGQAYVSTQLYFGGDNRIPDDHLFLSLTPQEQQISLRPVVQREYGFRQGKPQPTDVVTFDLVIDPNRPLKIERGELATIQAMAAEKLQGEETPTKNDFLPFINAAPTLSRRQFMARPK